MKKLLVLVWYCLIVCIAQGQTVVLSALKDNTIFNENANASNGAGMELYCGRTGTNANNALRRGLLQFKVDTIPANATINSVTLRINCTKKSPFANGANPIGLYSATQSWGEGTSNSAAGSGAPATNGDATWACRFSNGAGGCNLSWTASGGDYKSSPSAIINVDAPGVYTIPTSAGLVADIQRWVDTPSLNFGWLLIGDEATSYSSRAIASKESGVNGPMLTITYSLPACTVNTWTGAVSTAWETAANWSCHVVPDNSMQVIINSGTVVVGSNVVIKSLHLSNAANFSVSPGYTITVLQ